MTPLAGTLADLTRNVEKLKDTQREIDRLTAALEDALNVWGTPQGDWHRCSTCRKLIPPSEPYTHKLDRLGRSRAYCAEHTR